MSVDAYNDIIIDRDTWRLTFSDGGTYANYIKDYLNFPEPNDSGEVHIDAEYTDGVLTRTDIKTCSGQAIVENITTRDGIAVHVDWVMYPGAMPPSDTATVQHGQLDESHTGGILAFKPDDLTFQPADERGEAGNTLTVYRVLHGSERDEAEDIFYHRSMFTEEGRLSKSGGSGKKVDHTLYVPIMLRASRTRDT
jgi:hypothetical protein